MLLGVPAHLGYGALAGLVMGESAGLPIPGETALVAAALLARSGRLSLPIVIAVAAGAAIVGDNLGYWMGRRAGRRALLAERGPFRRHRRHLLARGELFFARHGAKAVVLGRFVAGIRVAAAVVAGATGMRARTFVIANAVGAIAWASLTALLATLLGAAGAIVLFVSGWAFVGVGFLGGVVSAWRARRRLAIRAGAVVEEGGAQ